MKSVREFVSRKKRLVIGLLVIAAIVAGGYYYFKQRRKDGLETAKVERGSVLEELTLSGEINATEYTTLSFETSGKLIYVGVKEGDQVKKGQILGKLDTTVLNSTYQKALADLREESATVDKVHDDVKDHDDDETYTQRDTRTTAEVAKDQAFEAVIIAERNLKGATIYAPFEGIVTSVTNPFPNVFTLYTQTQFELLNPKTFYFVVTADQTEITNLKLGQKAEIILDSFPEQPLEGKISQIAYSPSEDEVGTVYELKVGFSSEILDKDLFRLGMTGDALFTLSQAKDTLYVPADFLNTDKEGRYLLVNRGGEKKYVEVGIEGEDRVEVKGDIKEGDIVYD